MHQYYQRVHGCGPWWNQRDRKFKGKLVDSLDFEEKRWQRSKTSDCRRKDVTGWQETKATARETAKTQVACKETAN